LPTSESINKVADHLGGRAGGAGRGGRLFIWEMSMPFFVRQQLRSIKVGVYIMEAPDKEAAAALPLVEGDYTGHYTNDFPNPKIPSQVQGPFATKEEAQQSEAGWIEDV
jgi:hypothetical protein